MVELARIVHAADVRDDIDTSPYGRGLKAIAYGFAYLHGTDDHTKIALYYYRDDEKPELVMHNVDLTNNAIEIPPNEPRHTEVAYMDFPHDAHQAHGERRLVTMLFATWSV